MMASGIDRLIKISIVIPIFNESNIIGELWRLLGHVVENWKYDTEVIFINDGSVDDSLDILIDLNKTYPKIVKILSLSRNFGHQQALTCGINNASGDAVIMMDGDLQDDPGSLIRFIEKWLEGYEVVYAIRTKRKEFILKRFAFSLFYRIQSKIVDIAVPLDAGIFCLIDRKVANVMKQMREQNRYLPGLRTYAGFKQTGITVERGKRYSGKPRVSFLKLVKLATDGIFSMSHFPLRLATYVGLVIATFSFIIVAGVLYMKFFTDKASPGWASNLSATFFIGGVQLIFLGVIGEYLSRIYDEVKKRPYYIISQKIGFEQTEDQ